MLELILKTPLRFKNTFRNGFFYENNTSTENKGEKYRSTNAIMGNKNDNVINMLKW